MSKYLLILSFLLASYSSFSAGVQANYYYSLFNTSDGNPYIETYIVFFGSSLKGVPQDGNMMAEAEVSMVFTQEGNVKQFNKYTLKSPLVPAGSPIPNFIDQQRISIAPGMYNLEIRIKDVNDPASKELVFLDIINVEFRKDFIEFSGIQYLENYYPTTNQNILSKSGYDLELTRRLSEAVEVPVIASGGAGNLAHMAEVLKQGKASAVLAASIFHFGEYTVGQAKTYLAGEGIKVRRMNEE